MTLKLQLPIKSNELKKLKAGDELLLTGTLFTARDAAHKRMLKELPFDIRNQALYHTGPTPAKPGEVIGSCGPTTSARMDKYTPELLRRGLKVVIGKGELSADVVKAFKKNKAVFLVAPPGCGALLAEAVKKAEVIAYKDLGCEAVFKLEVENFPAVVAIDILGNNIYRKRGGLLERTNPDNY